MSRSLEPGIIPKTELGYNPTTSENDQESATPPYDANLFNERYQQQQQQVQNQGNDSETLSDPILGSIGPNLRLVSTVQQKTAHLEIII